MIINKMHQFLDSIIEIRFKEKIIMRIGIKLDRENIKLVIILGNKIGILIETILNLLIKIIIEIIQLNIIGN